MARTIFASALALLFAALTPAAFAAPPGQTLADQVEQAYQATDQYQGRVDFAVHQQQGRWLVNQETFFRVAYDRQNQRLLIDKPDLYLVIADGTLRLRSDELPGRHLETAAPAPLTYDALVQAVPFLADPPMVDLAFLLADDPVAAIGSEGEGAATLPPAEDDADQRPRLQVTTEQGPLTLAIDPQTNLIDEAVLDIDVAQMGGQAGDSVTMVYDVELERRNEPLPDDLFTFDATGSTAVASLQELVQGAAGGQGQGGGGHPLTNQPAPEIELTTMAGEPFKLSAVDADVVVLDFWATWCPPCREGLPKLQAVADWAKENDKSVAVYAVNVGETPEQARTYWQEQGFTMPVVMDQQNTAAQAYAVTGIPQTVVIADGQVEHVHVGFDPQMETQLKSEIDALLNEDAAAE